jgi:hypothetical protein
LFEERQTRSQAFVHKLRSIKDDLPEVNVSVEEGKPNWQKLTLNKRKAQLDAFRFKSPLNSPADMFWTFAVTGKVGRWYIVPAEGELDWDEFRPDPRGRI